MDQSLDLDPLERLTERERSTFTLYAQGYVVKEIANTLNVSVKTAETHLNNIERSRGFSSPAYVEPLAGANTGSYSNTGENPLDMEDSLKPITADPKEGCK